MASNWAYVLAFSALVAWFNGSNASPGADKQVVLLEDESAFSSNLATALNTRGVRVQRFNKTSLIAALLAGQVSTLVLPTGSDLSEQLVLPYLSFLRQGGSLVLLKGPPPRLNVTVAESIVNVFSPYEPYVMANVTRLMERHNSRTTTIVGNQPLSGLSAMAWTWNGLQTFTPVLEAQDCKNRFIGWAASQLINGPKSTFPGSRWLLSGVVQDDFYTTDPMLSTVVEFLNSTYSPLEKLVQQPSPVSTPLAASKSEGYVHVSSDKRHLLYPNGSRYFIIGANVYRNAYNNSISPSVVRSTLDKAVNAGVNTLRLFGFSSALTPDIIGLLRQYHADHGIHVLLEMECFKDKLQNTTAGIIEASRRVASQIANESWLLGYDLCNEIDNDAKYLPSIWINSTTQLVDKYPAMAYFGNLTQYLCQDWDSTFGNLCGNITEPIAKLTPANLQPILKDTSAALGDWISWRKQGIALGGDHNHLVTAGHNAFHGLLPANSALDFVAHHAYPRSPRSNHSLLEASYYNATGIPTTIARLQGIWQDDVRPVTLGEFGVRTTAGLGQLYDRPLSLDHTTGCNIDSNCLQGVVGSIDWLLTHGKSTCDQAWQQAVDDNAGPASVHHRCPAQYGLGPAAWENVQYRSCWSEIQRAAVESHLSTCTPSPLSFADVDFASSAIWESTVWLESLARGADGALRWCMDERPYVIAMHTDPWNGDDSLPTAHDSYVSQKFGYYWFDGVTSGQPKPIVYFTRFLAKYISISSSWTDAAKFRIDFKEETQPTSHLASTIGLGYVFMGPDIVVTGGRSDVDLPAVKAELNGAPTMLMIHLLAGSKVLLTTSCDVSVTLKCSQGPRTVQCNRGEEHVVTDCSVDPLSSSAL